MFYTLHKSDNGASIQVNKGDRLVVSLEEKPLSDIKWVWVHNPSLTLVDESKKTENNNLELRVFRFAVLDAAAEVVFNLENPYVNLIPSETFKFSITLK